MHVRKCIVRAAFIENLWEPLKIGKYLGDSVRSNNH
jgi:hypothetical protein